MKRLRTSQPDLFKTSLELPSPQRRTAVEMLKILLVEVMMSRVKYKQRQVQSGARR